MPHLNILKSLQASKKPEHPQECACCLSKIFFCWTIPSFVRGFRKTFTHSDLFPPLKEHEASNLGEKLEEVWNLEYFKRTKPSLLRVLVRIFGREFYKYGALIFFTEFVKLLQPISLYMLMTSFATKKNIFEHPSKLYIYTCTLLLSIFVHIICAHQYTFGLQRLGLKVKTACNSLIYKKSLRLSRHAVTKSTASQIVNLISNDVSRFDKLFIHLHYLWIAPMQCCVIMYLLFCVLDPSGMVGIGLFFAFIPLQILIGKLYARFRLKTARKTDERVRLINEIIAGIQVIKMYTWEDIFIKLTNRARREEIRHVSSTSYLKAAQKCFNRYLSKAAVFLCILTYVMTGNQMTPQFVFVIKSFYIIIRESMTTFFPESIKNLAEALVSIRRIENFLLCEERDCRTAANVNKPSDKRRIAFEKVCARWPNSSNCDTLQSVDFSASSGQLVTIFGTVGSGKSSLISVILRELPITCGELQIWGKISYAAQEPWLFAGTIRDNILFGQHFDVVRYKEVIKACALDLDFDALPLGDCSLIGDRGITLSGGQKSRISLARAIYKSADIYLFDDPLSALDASVAKQIFNSCFLNYLKDKCVVLLTHQLQFLEKSDIIYFMKNGKIVVSGDYEHLKNSGQEFAMLLKEEFEHEDLDTVSDEFNDILTMSYKEEDKKSCKENRNFGKVSWQTYKKYLLSGGVCAFAVIIALFVISQFLQSFVDYFEAYWVDLQQNKTVTPIIKAVLPFVNLENCVYVYSGFMLTILVFTILTSISFYAYFTSASIKMHHQMFSAMIKGIITFFYTHPSGAILNRFSKDIASIDLTIPKLLQDTLQTGLEMFAAITVISIISPWMALVSVPLIILFYLLRRFYLATNRELKRIDCVTRSPVFSHLNQSLQGLETIRAFCAEDNMKRQFDSHLNNNISAFYMFLACSSTFGFWLDVVCVIYITVVTCSSLWDRDISGADIGLLITQSMGLTNMLQWGMMQWSEFETEMTSVERVIEYTDIEPESQIEDSAVFIETHQLDNPTIEFKDVSLRYKSDAPYVLNSLDFKVNPREKIGIVGRTGAGKSSIISALFRLVKFDGKVLIGGVDIDKMPLNISRSIISIIPQEPVLFSGTVRENLDPYSEFADSKIWQILEELDLKRFVDTLPGGLESQIPEKGSNMSVGQKQLFCLARALLRENKILVLDEATANVDFKTDALIQSTIKTKFSKCTVLVIAHRLHTIIDCDKILVMDSGRVVEFDHPYKLLKNEDGALYSLVLKTGRSMLEFLREIARENYMNALNHLR